MRPEEWQPESIREAATRPMRGAGWRFWLLAAPLAAIVGLGLIAYGYQLLNGLGVTGLNDDVFWGVYTANLVAFIGISYGGAVVSAILRLTQASWRTPIARMAETMALVSLAIGALFPIIHIGRPERIWEFFVSPNISSPLVWDMAAISTYLIATLIFLYLPLIPDIAICRDRLGAAAGRWRMKIYSMLSLGWRGLPEQRQLLGWGMAVMAIAIIPLAVTVHSVLAWAFSVTTRAGWHSSIFGPYFVVAALLSGVATVILVVAAFRKAYHLERYITERQIVYLAYIMLALGLAYLYFTFAEFLTEGYVLDESTAPFMEALLLKNFAPLFWLFVIVGGGIPTLLVALPWTRTVRGIVVASALAVAGMWIKRFLIVVPPLAQPLIGSETLPYSPTWVEGAVTLGAAAAIPLFLMLFFRVFPVLSIYEMEEAASEESERRPAAVPGLQLAEGGQR